MSRGTGPESLNPKPSFGGGLGFSSQNYGLLLVMVDCSTTLFQGESSNLAARGPVRASGFMFKGAEGLE